MSSKQERDGAKRTRRRKKDNLNPNRNKKRTKSSALQREKSNFTKEQLEMKVGEQKMTIDRMKKQIDKLNVVISEQEKQIIELKESNENLKKSNEEIAKSKVKTVIKYVKEESGEENGRSSRQSSRASRRESRHSSRSRRRLDSEMSEDTPSPEASPEPVPMKRSMDIPQTEQLRPRNESRVRSSSINRPAPHKKLPVSGDKPRSKTPNASPRGGKRVRARTHATPPPLKALPAMTKFSSQNLPNTVAGALMAQPQPQAHERIRKMTAPNAPLPQFKSIVPNGAPSTANGAPSPGKGKKRGQLVQPTDPKYKKYETMKKIGMPEASIRNRMRMDGFKDAEIDAYFGNSGAADDGNFAGAAGGLGGALVIKSFEEQCKEHGLTPPKEVKPSKVKVLKRFHWHTIPVSQVKKSLWHDIHDTKSIKLGAAFELNFQPRQKKPKAGRKKNRSSKGSVAMREKIKWVNPKRDQSVQIGLSRLRMTNEKVYDLIRLCQDDRLDEEKFLTLLEIVPTQQEQIQAEQKANEFGDVSEGFGKTEMFFLELSAIPEVKTQLELLQFSRSFRDLYFARFEQVNAIIRSSQCIKKSKGLKQYLKIILHMGNLMNSGTRKARAFGFDLNDLHQINGIKDMSGKKTLAMWLYEFAYNNFPETEKIFKELSMLKTSARMDSTFVDASIKNMEAQFEKLDVFMNTLVEEYHSADSSNFRFKMIQFRKEKTPDMNKLKMKHKQAVTTAARTAEYLRFEMEAGKPETLFRAVNSFVESLLKAKDDIVKLEVQRKKEAKKRQRQRERQKKKSLGKEASSPLSPRSLQDRLKMKMEAAEEEEKVGNRLFSEIRSKADSLALLQRKVRGLVETQLQDQKDMEKGVEPASFARDQRKKKLSRHIPTLSITDMRSLKQSYRPSKTRRSNLSSVHEKGALPPLIKARPMGIGHRPGSRRRLNSRPQDVASPPHSRTSEAGQEYSTRRT